jgi:hypothetical protein
MSLNQIFSRLENCLINGDGHLSTEYHKVKSFFATFLSNGEYRKEHQNLINKTYAIHLASLADFYLNHEKVMEELRGVFNIEYTGLSKDIHDSLFDIQSALMYSNKKTYPHLIPDPYGVYGRAMNNEVASPSILKVEYLHDPIEDTDPEIVFLRLAIDRKRGRCTTHITIERTDEKNVH